MVAELMQYSYNYVQEGALQFKLPAGKYALTIKDQGVTINIDVLADSTNPKMEEGFLAQPGSIVEFNAGFVKPAYIASVASDDNHVPMQFPID